MYEKIMSGIELNKIAASVFLAGIIAMVSGLIAEGLHGEGGHGAHETRGFKVEVTAEEGSAAGAAEQKPVDIIPYLAKADLAAGEKLIGRCTSCHTFEKGKPNGVGPNQYGLVGNHMAHEPSFNYSDALKGKGGKWNFQELSEFLTSPQKYIPGNRMAYAGMKKPEERAAIIAYINQKFSDNPVPIPAVSAAPAEEAPAAHAEPAKGAHEAEGKKAK